MRNVNIETNPHLLGTPANSTLEMLPEVARKILSSDPAAEAEKKKAADEANMVGGQYQGKSKKADPKVSKSLLSCTKALWRRWCKGVACMEMGRKWRVDAICTSYTISTRP